MIHESDVFTSGDISRLLGVPIHKIQRTISRQQLRSIGRIGNSFIYDSTALGIIQDVLGQHSEPLALSTNPQPLA